MTGKSAGFAVACLAVTIFCARPVVAADRYAVVVTGASGEAQFAERYDQWRTRLIKVLVERLQFERDHVVALAEKSDATTQVSTADNVRATMAKLAAKMHARDLLLVVLIGHGTVEGTTGKFNLVGPDLDSTQWAAMFRNIAGQVVVVDTTSASFPFLPALSAKGRVVITATDSSAARYDTVFPEYFIKALETEATDRNRDNRVSIWEVFEATTGNVRRYYEQKGLLPIEHAMLDDAGDGFGKDAEQPGLDNSFARNVYLTVDPAERALDPATRELTSRRDDLLAELQKLKSKKSSMEEQVYQDRLEKLLVDLARVSHELRTKTGTNDQPFDSRNRPLAQGRQPTTNN